MKLPFEKMSPRLLLAVLALALPMAATPALASGPACSGTCPQASGTLQVSATIDSGITLSFSSDTGSGVTLGGTTTAATLAFGEFSQYANTSLASGATKDTGSPSWCTSCGWYVSSPFNLTVNVSNMTSNDYELQAALQASPSSGETVALGTTVASALALTTSAQSVTSTANYGQNTYYAALGFPTGDSSGSGGSISDTIAVTAIPQ